MEVLVIIFVLWLLFGGSGDKSGNKGGRGGGSKGGSGGNPRGGGAGRGDESRGAGREEPRGAGREEPRGAGRDEDLRSERAGGGNPRDRVGVSRENGGPIGRDRR